jgi:hypothetical protein
MTTFTLQDLTPTQININDLPVTHDLPDPTPLPPTPTLETIITNISTQLQLLATVIKEKGTNVPTEAGENSLQECVSTTLQQAQWFNDMVKDEAEELIDDKDFDYQIESAVESYFSNSFSLDDHVDITAEVETRVENIADGLIQDAVEERLAEIVSNKLQSLRITFD